MRAGPTSLDSPDDKSASADDEQVEHVTQSATRQLGDVDELALIDRIRERDETALGALYDRWVRSVYSLVFQLLLDPDDAEDVVEDVFWQIWRAASLYDPEENSVGTWILALARRSALERMRNSRRARATERVQMQYLLELASSYAPAEGDQHTSRRRKLVASILRLPPESARILDLAYFGGMLESEIASGVGEEVERVRRRAMHALHGLRGSEIDSEQREMQL